MGQDRHAALPDRSEARAVECEARAVLEEAQAVRAADRHAMPQRDLSDDLLPRPTLGACLGKAARQHHGGPHAEASRLFEHIGDSLRRKADQHGIRRRFHVREARDGGQAKDRGGGSMDWNDAPRIAALEQIADDEAARSAGPFRRTDDSDRCRPDETIKRDVAVCHAGHGGGLVQALERRVAEREVFLQGHVRELGHPLAPLGGGVSAAMASTL